MKRIIACFLFLSTLIATLTACSSASNANKNVAVDTSVFSSLICEQDSFSGHTYYYPNPKTGSINDVEYSRNGNTCSAYFVEADTWKLTASPVIHYIPDADIPYQLECILQYHYRQWDSYTGLSFREAIIVTDNHRYNVSDIFETETLGVYNSVNIITLGKKGIAMLKDICSCSSVQMRMVEHGGDSEDITVDGSVFKSVLDVISLYEAAGCGQYNFADYDADITVS